MSPIWAKKDGSRAWEFELVGIYDGNKKGVDLTGLHFRYDYFEETRMERAKGLVGWYTIRVKDPAHAEDIAKKVDEEFANSQYETKTETEGAFAQSFAKQVGDIATLTAAIVAAVFFTIMLVAGNTMAQAVRERTGELGALKAIGFTNPQVLGLVLAESLLLALIGGGIGLGLAAAIISRGDPTGSLLPTFHLPAEDLARGCLYVLALGLIAGVFPALQAMRLRTAEALRRM
jgi:putative ABC transport system permease protein